jgi:predicted porin
MKSFIAATCAAGALLSSDVHAQAPAPGGSVTLFGIVDVYAGRQQLAGRPSTKAVNPGALTTSRWGFTGSEDLGGGLRANFSVVSLFRPDTGLPGRFDGDAFFASRSTVGLSGGFGQVNLGRMNSPLFFALLRFDAHELGGQTPTFLHTFPGGQPLAAPQLVPDSTINNGIQYATPVWGGFSATVHASAAETSGKTKGRTGWSVNYTAGALSIGAAGDSIDAPVQPGVRHQTAWMVAGSYDLQSVKLSAIHQRHEQEGVGNDYQIDSLGASVPLGQSKLMFSWARTQLDRATAVDLTRNTLALTWDYFLSKRTDVYLHGMVDRMSATPRGNTLIAGVRHRF